jgi:hypothetical protein
MKATNIVSAAMPGPGLGTNELRDIKPPVAIPSGWAWLGWVLAGAVLGVLLYLAWRWWQRRRKVLLVVPGIPPHERARQKLQEALALIGQPREFCILVSDTIRIYLEERFEFRAPERTTEEFLHELQGTDRLIEPQKESLGQFLQSCDLVKFARYEPGEPELRELHASALRLIAETEPVAALPGVETVAQAPSSAESQQASGSAAATQSEPRQPGGLADGSKPEACSTTKKVP